MTNRNLIALLAVLAVAACGGGAKKTDTTPTPDPIAADPERALTEAECTEVMAHVIAMPAPPEMAEIVDKMKADHDQHVKECAEVGKKKDYDCAMAAQTWEQLGQCEPPGEDDGATDGMTPPAEPAVD